MLVLWNLFAYTLLLSYTTPDVLCFIRCSKSDMNQDRFEYVMEMKIVLILINKKPSTNLKIENELYTSKTSTKTQHWSPFAPAKTNESQPAQDAILQTSQNSKANHNEQSGTQKKTRTPKPCINPSIYPHKP